jgi:hypothetical protein
MASFVIENKHAAWPLTIDHHHGVILCAREGCGGMVGTEEPYWREKGLNVVLLVTDIIAHSKKCRGKGDT